MKNKRLTAKAFTLAKNKALYIRKELSKYEDTAASNSTFKVRYGNLTFKDLYVQAKEELRAS